MADDDRSHRPYAGGPSAPSLELYRCRESHAFFFPHKTCPRCRGRLERFESPPQGTIVSHTIVRVSPTGSPFALGLVRVACGAQTLCIVDDEAGGEVPKEVVLVARDGLYHAMSLPG